MRLQLSDHSRTPKIAGQMLSLEALQPIEASVATFEVNSQFDIYPYRFLKQSGLRRVILCRNLFYAGQKRAAVPDFRGRSLYIDANYVVDKEYFRLIIHHEFFHVVDYFLLNKGCNNDKWLELNDAGFQYGSGGANRREPICGRLTRSLPGFLTIYSTSAMEEDRAELFSHMVVNYKYVEEQAITDLILRAKLTHLQAEIVNACDNIDNYFWAGRQNMDLWQNL